MKKLKFLNNYDSFNESKKKSKKEDDYCTNCHGEGCVDCMTQKEEKTKEDKKEKKESDKKFVDQWTGEFNTGKTPKELNIKTKKDKKNKKK